MRPVWWRPAHRGVVEPGEGRQVNESTDSVAEGDEEKAEAKFDEVADGDADVKRVKRQTEENPEEKDKKTCSRA